ncbi:MAG: fasciclin domain-containing protein [Prolixibacteraceae bacterium]
MKINHLFRNGVILCITAFSMFGVVSCNPDEEFDPSKGPSGKARYVPPTWLGGTSLEILEDTAHAANYSIFIKLMDKAELRDQIKSQLFTLFVPNDDAFKAYFAKHGIGSVDDLSDLEAEKLFKLHFVTNARSAYQLKYEYYWAELQGPQGEYASLFYRKMTGATTIPYKEKVRYNPDFLTKGDNGELLIYNDFKMIPLMSRDFFEDFFGDPEGSDYELMYPGSEWGNNLNWHNANVTEAEVPTASGFIYYVDQVVDNMESIEEYLMQHQDQFGVFYDLVQRFANYTAGKKFETYGETLLYKKSYDLIFNIADEYGPDNSEPNRYKSTFSVFAPIDNVMQKYLDDTVLKYYESLDSVPEVTLYYIVQTQISQSLALMSKIENSYFNSFGDEGSVKRSDVLSCQMCSNGPVYAMNTVMEPNVFTCVPRRLFFDNNYSTFLFGLDQAQMLSQISDPNQDVTVFAVNNAQMEAANIRYNSLSDMIETRGEEGIWQAINDEALAEFLEDHIYEGVLNDLSGEGFLEMSSKNYVHYNNNKLEAGKNMALKEMATISNKEVNERNGILYDINKAVKTNFTVGQYLLNDPDISLFAALMDSAGLLNPDFIDPYTLDVIAKVSFIAEADYWTAFIPNNAAMTAALDNGLIPTDPDALKDFLSYHFIRKAVIFDDGKLNGEFTSNSIAEVTPLGVVYNKLSISNSPQNLAVTDGKGNKVSVNHTNANSLVRRGVAHKITSVLVK